MKKRILSVLLAIAMVAVVLATGFAAMAAETPALKVDVAVAGETVTATVTAQAASKVATGQFTLKYDTEKLELVSVECPVDMFNEETGICVFLQPKGEAYEVDTVILTAVFKVKSAPVTAGIVSITDVDAYTESFDSAYETEEDVVEDFVCDHSAITAWEVTKEATATEDGEKKATCPVCGEEVTEVIPALGVTPDEPTTGDTNPTEKPSTGDKTPAQDNKPAAKPNAGDKSPATGATVGVSAVSVMAAAAVVTLLARKKKED